MDRKSVKKLIIFLIIILLMISITIIIAISYLNVSNMQNINNNAEEGGEDFTKNYGKIENGLVDEQAYYDILACMKKYLNTINIKSTQYGSYDEQGNYIRTSEEREIKQKIYNLLGQKHISEKNITVENIQQHIKVVQEATTYVPLEISMIQDADIKSFIVYGLIESTENYNVLDKIFAVINIDFYDNNFTIEPIYGDYNSISEIKLESFEDTITSNNDNKFNPVYLRASEIPEQYINLYKRLALGYPEKMYELLDEEYRNAKFGNIDVFKNYIEKNKEEIKLIQLDKYEVITTNNKVQYVCVDQKENYYIFKQNETFQDYSVILDTYTIDLPEFVEKYNSVTDKVKVGMNIEKVISAINDGDYSYVYRKLDNTFKNNKFSTISNLQTYIENNFYEKNNIEYIEFSQEGDIYIYKAKITDKNKKTSQEKYLNIVMQLGEGTDFKMSFSV